MCFFFKQKTAYEMRISDWSSEVCSSDLLGGLHRLQRHLFPHVHCRRAGHEPARLGLPAISRGHQSLDLAVGVRAWPRLLRRPPQYPGGVARSEEHTSELQSLMRIPYAVFCLKKKKH